MTDWIIPTRFKSRIAHDLSYPIGAQAISDALVGAPDVEQFELWFQDSPVWRQTEFRRMLVQHTPYPILTTGHSERSRARRYADDAQLIYICAVLRTLRSSAHKLLLEEGLPKLRMWFDELPRRNRECRGATFQLIFDPAAGAINAKITEFNDP